MRSITPCSSTSPIARVEAVSSPSRPAHPRRAHAARRGKPTRQARRRQGQELAIVGAFIAACILHGDAPADGGIFSGRASLRWQRNTAWASRVVRFELGKLVHFLQTQHVAAKKKTGRRAGAPPRWPIRAPTWQATGNAAPTGLRAAARAPDQLPREGPALRGEIEHQRPLHQRVVGSSGVAVGVRHGRRQQRHLRCRPARWAREFARSASQGSECDGGPTVPDAARARQRYAIVGASRPLTA